MAPRTQHAYIIKTIMAGEIAVDGNHQVYVPDYMNQAIFKFNGSQLTDASDNTPSQTWHTNLFYLNNYSDTTSSVMPYDVDPSGDLVAGISNGNGVLFPSGSFTFSVMFDSGLAAGVASKGMLLYYFSKIMTNSISYDSAHNNWYFLGIGGFETNNSLYINSNGGELSQFNNMLSSVAMMVGSNINTHNDYLTVLGYSSDNYNWHTSEHLPIYVYTCDNLGDCAIGNNFFLAMNNETIMDTSNAGSNSLFKDYLMTKDIWGDIFIYNGAGGIAAYAPEEFSGQFLINLPTGFTISSMAWNLSNNMSQLVIGGSLSLNGTTTPDVEVCNFNGTIFPNLSCGNGGWTDLGSPFTNNTDLNNAVIGTDTATGTIYAVSNDGSHFATYQYMIDPARGALLQQHAERV